MKNISTFINEGRAYRIEGLSDKAMSLLNAIFKENKQSIDELAKRQGLEEELNTILYRIKQPKTYYLGCGDDCEEEY